MSEKIEACVCGRARERAHTPILYVVPDYVSEQQESSKPYGRCVLCELCGWHGSSHWSDNPDEACDAAISAWNEVMLPARAWRKMKDKIMSTEGGPAR